MMSNDVNLPRDSFPGLSLGNTCHMISFQASHWPSPSAPPPLFSNNIYKRTPPTPPKKTPNFFWTAHVMCHLSHVTCKKKLFYIFLYKNNKEEEEKYIYYPSEKLDKVVELIGGGSVINGAYPV